MRKLEPRLDEVRALLREMPGPDLSAQEAAEAHQAELAQLGGGLGRLKDLAVWLATWQGAQPPRMERPRVAVFAANHGIAARGLPDLDPEMTARMVQVYVSGGGAVNQLAAIVGADLRVYEMALDQPTADFTQGPAMSEEDCANALAYGMMAVEVGFDVMALGDLGAGNDICAAALCHALFGGEAADWVDMGDDTDAERQRVLVAEAVAANRAAFDDPFGVLQALGGLELAAIVGAVLACRLGRIPVVLDGFVCSAAAAVLYAVEPHLLDHCVVAQRAQGKAHDHLLSKLGKRPLLDLEMRSGEGVGAALAIQLLQGAVACHNGMASRRKAGLEG